MSGVYELLLIVHSFTRWWVLVACLLTMARACSRRASVARWSRFDDGAARVFVASIDVQVLFGLSLYFGVSPLARAARALWSEQGFGAMWAERELSFFGLIHPCLALLAAFVVHAAWVAARRTDSPGVRRRRLGAGAALALGLFLMAVPWPFLGHERPWFRFHQTLAEPDGGAWHAGGVSASRYVRVREPVAALGVSARSGSPALNRGLPALRPQR